MKKQWPFRAGCSTVNMFQLVFFQTCTTAKILQVYNHAMLFEKTTHNYACIIIMSSNEAKFAVSFNSKPLPAPIYLCAILHC